ncbi:MAG: HlyD family efflux transporter periplasmic adaptor subunit [Leptolyngbyaceae cyanobacterium bins.302]|nr:HlyD family efflux transporter periplasmic adaptor subunit [Leptolyngbyaceae cyanobacterium bins.302]
MSTQFDQPVILRRSPKWSRAVVWGIVGVTTFTVLWATLAKIEEAVSATGQLEPQGTVRDIRVPINGVVENVNVKDGDRVTQGTILLTLEQETADAQVTSLKKIRDALKAETLFYRQEMGNQTSEQVAAIAEYKLPPEMLALTKSRAGLVTETALFRAQLTGSTEGISLTPEQRLRLQSSSAEVATRERTAQLEVEQLERQLAQIQVQLKTAKEILRINDGIYNNLTEVANQGGVPRIQYLRQEQELKNSQAKVEQLQEEQGRLRVAIAQAKQKLQNTVALSQQDLLTKIAENEKNIASIDSELNKAIVENEKKIAEIDSQLKQAEQTLKYQAVRSPVDGTVFDLKASGAGYVATTAEPVLKVVPRDALKVELFVPNKDIGFIKTGLPVDVRVDSFPFSEFGDLKGVVESIGSDALPPTQERPFYSFPVKVRLDDTSGLKNNGRDLRLQSGMSVSANIKIRQRSIMSIFVDGFTQKVDNFKSVR